MATKQCATKVDSLNIVNTFNDSIQALSFIASNPVDLIFLDIEMPELNGMEFIRALQQPRPHIILTTSHTEFALEAFQENVLDYLVKPIELPRFIIAVNKAKIMLEKHRIDHVDNDTLFIKKGNLIVRINKLDVLWIEGLGDYVTINTEKEKFIVHSTMHAIEQKFNSKEFMRVHRSFIIRIDKINNIEDNCISYFDKFIPIGKTYKESVYKRLNML
ncbi:MAG: response regulator transcription factor [Bacteroidia bacterium]|nr:response regulator transcription factor [Bacteroidia bacterium]